MDVVVGLESDTAWLQAAHVVVAVEVGIRYRVDCSLRHLGHRLEFALQRLAICKERVG